MMSSTRLGHDEPVAASSAAAYDALVLSGGGVRGTYILGAVHEFQRAGLLRGVRTVAGTSVGAVIAALLALDPQRDLWKVLRDHVLDHTYVPDMDISNLGPPRFGLDGGSGLKEWLVEVLGGPAAANLTLGQVQRAHGIDVVVCATNLNARKPVYFSALTHPDVRLLHVLHASCAIPLYFSAVRMPHDGCLYVDGAVADNWPIGSVLERGCRRVLAIRVLAGGRGSNGGGGPPRPHHRRAAATEEEDDWTTEKFIACLLDSITWKEAPRGVDALHLDSEGAPTVLTALFSSSRAETIGMHDAGRRQAGAFIQRRASAGEGGAE